MSPKTVLALLIMGGGLSACVAYESPPPAYRTGAPAYYRGDMDRDGIRNSADRDRDGDGVPNRRDRDRDGDRVPNRQDRYPDNPRRY